MKWLVKKCFLWVIVYIICLGIFSIIADAQGASLSALILGLTAQADRTDYAIRINLLSVMQWICLLIPPLYLSGYMIERHIKMFYVEVFRWKSYISWWKNIVAQVIYQLIVYLLLLYIFARIIYGAMDCSLIIAVTLIGLHLLLLTGILSSAILYFGQAMLPFLIIIFAESCGILMASRNLEIKNGLLPIWAMYQQSSLVENGGFSISKIVFIESIVIIILFLLNFKIVKIISRRREYKRK